MKKNVEPLVLKFVPVPFSIKEEGGIRGGQLIYSLKEKTRRLFFKVGTEFTPINALIKDFSTQFAPVEPYLVSLDEEVSVGDYCIAYGKEGAEITTIQVGRVVANENTTITFQPLHAKTQQPSVDLKQSPIDLVLKVIVFPTDILMPSDLIGSKSFYKLFNEIFDNDGNCEVDVVNNKIIRNKDGKIEVKFCADNYKRIEDL